MGISRGIFSVTFQLKIIPLLCKRFREESTAFIASHFSAIIVHLRLQQRLFRQRADTPEGRKPV